MTAPKRRAVPPFEVRRDAAGYVDGIVRGDWLVLHLATSQRNEENADLIVARLNAAPLDWPLRYNGRKRRVSNECAAAVKKALSVARGAKGGGGWGGVMPCGRELRTTSSTSDSMRPFAPLRPDVCCRNKSGRRVPAQGSHRAPVRRGVSVSRN